VPRKTRPRNGGPQFDPKTILARLKGTNSRAYGPSVQIYAQGDPSTTVFYVEKGQIQLSVVSRQGKEAVIAILNSHSFFGEACLNGQSVRPAAARTVTSCVLSEIPKRAMVSTLRTDPAFSAYFVSYLLSRGQRVEEDLLDQLFNSSEKRLARLLLLLAQVGKDSKPTRILPRVNQGTLAGMIGTTRERVSYFMNKFRRLGLIEYNGELRVHDSLIQLVLHD